MSEDPKERSNELPGWNHVPDVPIQVSPFFTWPPNARAMGRWIAVRWLRIAENSIILMIAISCWIWFQPALETMKTLEPGWILALWVRNLVLMFLVAGGLHMVLFTLRRQGDRLRYDGRPLAHRGRQFSFGGQVRDNMFWTLTSGVGVWTGYEVAIFWAMANGWVPTVSLIDRPVLIAALIVLTPVWISFHFYWIHRLLHWPPIYRIAHALHHRNVNVGPWSGLSMHPLEHLLFFSSVLVHLVVPAHPIVILFHMQHQALTAATSHAGYEHLLVRDRRALALGTFHHQMHHRYFEVNYGNLEMPWDKWFGTFHDGTLSAHERLKRRARTRKA